MHKVLGSGFVYSTEKELVPYGLGHGVCVYRYICGCPKQPEEGIGSLVPELQAVVDCLIEVLGTEVRSAARTVSGLSY